MRKFWIWVAVLGVPVFIGGLIWTIVLTDETGEVRPDSECSTTMRASVRALECVVSNDPKVLLGVAPMLLGLAMVGVGIWRAIAAPAPEGSSGGGGGGLFGSIKALQQQAMQMQESAMGTMSAGDTPGAPTTPPTATPPPPSPAPPPTPPAPNEPGE